MYIFKENKITPYDINFNEKYGLSISVVRNAVINYHEYHDLDIESKTKADLLVYY